MFYSRSPLPLALLALAWLCAAGAPAQEDLTGGSSGSSPSTTTTTTSPTTTTTPSTGTSTGTSTTGTTGGDTGGSITNQTAPAPENNGSSVTTVGGGSFVSQTLTPGEGRFAQPPFRFSVDVAQGYDDNVFDTPTKQAPQVRVPVPVLRPDGTIAFRKGPAPPPPVDRTASAITSATATAQIRLDSPRFVLSLDAALSTLHYFNRPGAKPNDYNGSLSLVTNYRLTPRLQLTAQADAVYQSEPDFSRINSPTAQGSGDYLQADTRLDLSYQVTPRMSTVLSLGLNTLQFQDTLAAVGDFNDLNGGLQFRYLVWPRITLVSEFRYSDVTYKSQPILDSHTQYFLAGAEATITPRLNGSLRVGASDRTYAAGISSVTPYAEGYLIYAYRPQSQLVWNLRYGFEESNSPSVRRTVLRSGLNFNHTVGSNLSGTLGLFYTRTHDQDDVSGLSNTDQALEANLETGYVITRSLTLTLSYYYTLLVSQNQFAGYYRNRVFIGVRYTF